MKKKPAKKAGAAKATGTAKKKETAPAAQVDAVKDLYEVMGIEDGLANPAKASAKQVAEELKDLAKELAPEDAIKDSTRKTLIDLGLIKEEKPKKAKAAKKAKAEKPVDDEPEDDEEEEEEEEPEDEEEDDDEEEEPEPPKKKAKAKPAKKSKSKPKKKESKEFRVTKSIAKFVKLVAKKPATMSSVKKRLGRTFYQAWKKFQANGIGSKDDEGRLSLTAKEAASLLENVE